MSQSTALPTSHAPNGVLTAPVGRAAVGGNKKKAKRRAKVAAKQATDVDMHHMVPPPLNRQATAQAPYPPHGYNHEHIDARYAPGTYPDQQAYEEHLDYSSDEDDNPLAYESHQHTLPTRAIFGDEMPLPPSRSMPNDKRQAHNHNLPYGSDPAAMINSAMSHFQLPNPPPPPPMTANRSTNRRQDRIWNTSTQEERGRIKEFWLSLSEEERKGLLKIEKTAVLNKMKEQQKHSCSCTVCGRKRTAIEEELEVLYDAYYEELAQYANHQGDPGVEMLDQRPSSLPYHHTHALQTPRPLHTAHPHHRTSRVHEILDDGEAEYSEEDVEEVYSEDEDDIYSEEEYEDEVPAGIGSGFFDFGNNLTVKGGSFITDMLTQLYGRLNNLPDGILTVADDLLKNDGKKFIEMMEQLAERRMQREQEVEYASQQPAHANTHEPPLDDEEDYDDEDDYDSQEEYDDDEEEDEMGGMTEEQRMEEGRRMFQIFAARMFEQRVLTAYRERVAQERQARLLEELEEESNMKTQKDAKKAKDAEKKKGKKLAQKQAKAEEKARRDAERAAEEAFAKAEEEKKLEEQRRKKEDQRRKKEAEKKAAEEERLRKDTERARRQQDERERQAESERKAREQKVEEKRQRDEVKQRGREEREKAMRDQKAAEEQQKRDQEMKESQQQAKRSTQPPTPQIIKRPSQLGQIAVPPTLKSQKSASVVSSPHVPVATPVVPKATVPVVRAHRSSQHESHQPSTKPADLDAAPAKTRSPSSDMHGHVAPKTILQNPHKQQPRPPVSLPNAVSHQGPPPGMHPPYQTGFSNIGFPPYPGQHGPQVQQRPGASQYAHQALPGSAYRQFPPHAGPPPGPNGFGAISHGRGFAGEPPPGFPQQMPGLGTHAPPGMPGSRAMGPSHSRQPSANDHDMSPPSHTQPITRPAPIQRPSSVRPSAEYGEIEDINNHLGSRALLDDADEPMPPIPESRRVSNPIGAGRGGNMGFSSPLFGATPFSQPGTWSAPTAFGPAPPGLNGTTWGSAALGPSSGWSTSAFGPLSSGPRSTNPNRPRALRVAICQACRQMNTPANDYHDVHVLLQQIERNGFPDMPPNLNEIEEICETEGDGQNGGGLLHIRKSGVDFAVRYEPDSATPGAGRPGGLGEIGSPVPGNSMPVIGRGFGNLGGPGGF